ncbi:MAG: GNAT family N-acetyltransferase [Pseudomonadota bacterium]
MPDRPAIVVRRVRRDDAAAIAAMMSDPQIARGLLQMPHGSEDFWRKRIDDMPAGNAVLDIMLVAERGGLVVGNAGLLGVAALRRRHVAGLGISVAQSAQGQGVGTALMAALVDWADNWAQLLRLELTVFTDNVAAIALYRKFGFADEGVHRSYALRDGAYADVLAMARLHPNPPSLR